MKKLIYILFVFLAIGAQAQTSNGTEFEADGFNSNSPQTVTSAVNMATMGADGTIGKITPYNLLDYAKPEDFGAVGDGVTDDYTALQNAINSGKSVFIGDKTYLTNSTLTITTEKNIVGAGNLAIIKTTSNLPIFDIQSSGVRISNLKLLGNGRGSGTNYVTTRPLQNGIYISGFYFDININRVTFENLGNAGVYGLDNTVTGSTNIKNGVNINSCEFRDSLIGVFFDTEFEFNIIDNSYFRGNEWGFRNNAGNNAIHGGQIIKNRTGVSLESGLNNAHSVCNGVHINQNTDRGIYANGVTNGYVFANCVVFFNKIEIVSSIGITFDGGEYGVSTGGLNITGSTNTTFQNINFLTTPPITESGNTNLKFFNNTFVATRSASMPETLDNLELLNSLNGTPLKIRTGSGLNSGITGMSYGGINFGNAQTSTLSPLMAGKSNDNAGLFLIGMSNNSNLFGDFIFDVRENDNTDFSTISTAAFRFTRFSLTDLFTIMRNGNATLLGDFTAPNVIANNLKFPSTQVPSANVNTLDDYKEGTFTPVVEGLTTIGVGTYTSQDGYYTKVGNLVTVIIKLVWTAHTGTGSMIVRGLPYTSRKTDTQCAIYGDALTLTANNYLAAIIPLNSVSINIRQSPTGTIASNVVAIDAAATLTITATYMTD